VIESLQMKVRVYAVYIMTNKYNTVLYIGFTNNIARRVYEHKNKHHKGFTKKYNVTKLVYYELFEDAKLAIKREKTLKNLVRRRKDELINNINPEWKDLYGKLLV